MNILRTALTSLLLGLAALPAAADGFGIVDLPRLDFPTGPDVGRACAGAAAPACAPVNG
jgi:hypothetical protein